MTNGSDMRAVEHIEAAGRAVARAEAYVRGDRVNEYGMRLDGGDFRAMLQNASSELAQADAWIDCRQASSQRKRHADEVRERLTRLQR